MCNAAYVFVRVCINVYVCRVRVCFFDSFCACLFLHYVYCASSSPNYLFIYLFGSIITENGIADKYDDRRQLYVFWPVVSFFLTTT